jgi:hypothetical protein
MGKVINAFYFGKYEEKRSLLRTRRRWKDNIKVDFTEEREANCFDVGHEASASAKDGGIS